MGARLRSCDPMATARFLQFRVNGESFLLDIGSARQILPYVRSTPLPGSPGFIDGVIVHRDESIPLVDLRRRLFPSAGEAPPGRLVILCDAAGGKVGYIVDEVRRIATIELDLILPPPLAIGGMAGRMFVGVVGGADRTQLILDAERILDENELAALATVNG